MPTSYINLVNKVLRRLNEVELDTGNFGNPRGIHAMAKDAVNDSIRYINTKNYEWPFNAVEHTQAILKGVEEYGWPVDFSNADWDTFQLQKDTNLNIASRNLQEISRNDWYQKLKDWDDDSGINGRGIPEYVFPTHGNGYGVSPSPNNNYSLKFRYYTNFASLVASTDQSKIPSQFDYVIVDGAMYYMYLFNENTEKATVMNAKLDQGINQMSTLLVDNEFRMRDTRVRY